LSARAPSALLAAATSAAVLAGCAPATTGAPQAQPVRIGAIFPLGASSQPEAAQEYLGVSIAADLVNHDGGVRGRPVRLELEDVDTVAGARVAAARLRADGVPAVIGAYSSALSIAASSAVAAGGMVYWESGAVADRLTGRGLPTVFRVGADGAQLGGNSARFLLDQLAPRLHRAAGSLRVFLVTADDDYARSVSDGARAVLTAAPVASVEEAVYDPFAPYWPSTLHALEAARPDAVLLSSHIPDGVSFRRAFVAAGLHAGAFIGTTMAQCPPTFGSELGAAALGVFASDRPDGPFNPVALSSAARALYARFAAAWRLRTRYAPSDEGIAGFSAAWALFHQVLPRAKSLGPPDIAAAARALDLPDGSLPDGAGVRFSTAPAQLGQNLRAAAVVEQWQSATSAPVVWPPSYATGRIEMVLPAA
jgi:branched-chain amino acid transport system substrate-binding protein